MPKTPARDDYFAQSFRFTPEQAAVLKEEAQRLGSTTTCVRQLLDDYRTLYGLPEASPSSWMRKRRRSERAVANTSSTCFHSEERSCSKVKFRFAPKEPNLRSANYARGK